MEFFAAPHGSDSWDGKSLIDPVRNIQRAVDLAKSGDIINVSDGTYSGGVILAHHKSLEIRGNQVNPLAVELQLLASEVGFWVQDMAVLQLSGLTIRPLENGCTGFRTRQFSIGDLRRVHFKAHPLGIMVEATEISKLNVLEGNVMRGSATLMARANGQSSMTIGEISFEGSPAFTTVLTVIEQSLMLANTATFAGVVTGKKYAVDDSSLLVKGNVTIPGDVAGTGPTA